MREKIENRNTGNRESVKVAKKPREYVGDYLDLHPDIEAQAGQVDGVRYEDLAVMVSEYAGISVPKTTVYREVKRRAKA